MRRAAGWLVCGAGILLLPVTCIPLLLLCNAVNPMALAFKTSFTVENALTEPIFVTPIGTVGPEGLRTQLPLLAPGPFYWLASQRANFRIDPGQTLRLHYDWDDVNFSELVVQTAARQGVLIVDPHPTANQYHATNGHFVIYSLDTLATLTPGVAAAVNEKRSRLRAWMLCGLGILAPILTLYGRRFVKRTPAAPPAG